MPSAGEFNNGPEGAGAALGVKDHVPSGAEFSDGPQGIGGTSPSVGAEDTNRYGWSGAGAGRLGRRARRARRRSAVDRDEDAGADQRPRV